MTNGAQLQTQTDGQGDAGNIQINSSDFVSVSGSSSITGYSSAFFTNTNSIKRGGSITVVTGAFRLSNGALLDARTRSSGNGGNITLAANTIIALEDSDILAFAPEGQGGNITFNTRAFLSSPLYRPTRSTSDRTTLEALATNDRVDVNASGAVSGTISGVPDTTFLQNSLTDLQQNPIDTNALIANSCIARTGKLESTFTIAGSGGLPYHPGDASPSNYPTGTVRNVENNGTNNSSSSLPHRPWTLGDPIVEPTGVYQLPSGQLVMSRECH